MLSRRLLRIKAIKALYAHFKSESDSPKSSEKNLALSIDKIYQLYHLILSLPVEVKRYAEERIDLGKRKKLPTGSDLNPNLKFVQNKLIDQLELSDCLGTYLKSHSLGWNTYPELIKNLYNSLVDSEYYKSYMGNPNSSYKEDVRLVENFFLNEVSENELLERVLEEFSIFWADDLDYSLIMVMRTLEGCRQNKDDISLLPMYKGDDDKNFVEELFRSSLVNYNDYLASLEKFTDNWDVERIAFMDTLIMVAAMVEFTKFDSIPVNVTMDEYIEIAKYYSTPASSLFINGILDKVVDNMRKQGKINKVGRGLL